jgi:hypothetical protein
MALSLHFDRAERSRVGSCHRCGWKSDLHRSSQHDRGSRPDISYRWLCTECVGDLNRPARSANVPDASSGMDAMLEDSYRAENVAI